MKRAHLHRWCLLAAATCIGSAVGCNGAVPPTAPDAVAVTPVEGPTGSGRTSAFVRTGYAVAGTATLVTENGVARLTFSSNFNIAQTPGPVVYLNTTNNANTGQPLRVGALQSRQGAQTYTFQVPPGVTYGWVLIWCDPFNVSMAHAPL
ncbi:DM13 domain-containing protein [Gemmatimonas groenlandica]|uniref:DM13 domain-containing protein n=1 Tax=Gemmatimonas groenlandica TaxID=2732249 RepID=A0A6M4J0A8_9BACT|nr:DM13 domain-containing protein [Gemmatimonas groenlandica]QJR37901.1 DM13 domain-containing protein [Gemmatimonas groenlandica]